MRQIISITSGRTHVEHEPDCAFNWGQECDCYGHPALAATALVIGSAFCILVWGCVLYSCQRKPQSAKPATVGMYLTDVQIAPTDEQAQKVREYLAARRWLDQYACDHKNIGDWRSAHEMARCTGKL